MNKAVFEIDNCCDCQYSQINNMNLSYPFEYEEGLYCVKMNSKLIAVDDWNLRKRIDIPNWCPFIKKF